MKEYLFEMHLHSSEVSRCANVPCEEITEIYEKLGYDGIVITNHMNTRSFMKAHLEDAPWSDKADFFLSGYRKLKKLGEGKFTVLLGMELCFYEDPNDYLVYGITEDFVKNNGDLMAMDVESFSKLAKENGVLFLQAHPFRRGMEVADWKYLDGYEVFNGNPRHYSSNEIAEKWAEYHGKKIVTSGSDFHEYEDAGMGGIYFKKPILTNENLLSALRSGSYRLKKTDFAHTRPE